MTGIPVMIHLDKNTFNRLEAIAKSKRTNIRKLIVDHLTQPTTLVPRRNDPRLVDLNAAQQNDIITLTHRGLSTDELAEHFDVHRRTIQTWQRRAREAGLIS